ncbi:MAG TPA: type VII secretion-associated protein, partial [Mycobacterium sp.]|nr:type VII secretion-associated protein [Mycobacterium sp.]
MSDIVIEVGPSTVRAPYELPAELVSAAIQYIDDDLALLGERAVRVADLWAELVSRAAGEDADAVVLVCPTWWSTARIDTVRLAAESVVAEAAVERRTPLLQVEGATVVEIAAELVVVTRAGATAAVIPVLGE